MDFGLVESRTEQVCIQKGAEDLLPAGECPKDLR